MLTVQVWVVDAKSGVKKSIGNTARKTSLKWNPDTSPDKRCWSSQPGLWPEMSIPGLLLTVIFLFWGRCYDVFYISLTLHTSLYLRHKPDQLTWISGTHFPLVPTASIFLNPILLVCFSLLFSIVMWAEFPVHCLHSTDNLFFLLTVLQNELFVMLVCVQCCFQKVLCLQPTEGSQMSLLTRQNGLMLVSSESAFSPPFLLYPPSFEKWLPSINSLLHWFWNYASKHHPYKISPNQHFVACGQNLLVT